VRYQLSKITTILLFFVLILIHSPESMEISLFPAFSIENKKSPSRFEINLGFPLFHMSLEKDRAEANIPFLFSLEKEGENMVLDFVWPIFTYRKRPRPGGEGQRSQTTLFPLFNASSKTESAGGYRKWSLFPLFFSGRDAENHPHFILFPFFWYADEARLYFPFPSTRPQTYFAIFPLYGQFRNLGGNNLIQTLVWPLFVRIKHKEKTKYHFLWPFFGYGRGEDYSALRAWPLFIWGRHPDGSIRCNYLWPFGYHRRKPLEEGEFLSLDMLLPLFLRFRSPREKWDYYFIVYGRRDSPQRRQWSVLWPLFKTGYYPKTDARSLTLLLFLFKYKNGEEDSILQLFPLFGRRYTPEKTRSFFLWPLYHYKFNDYGNHTFERRYLFPFYIRKSIVDKDGSRERRTVLFPFFAETKKTDGSWKKSSMRLFYYDKADALDRNWSSLLPLYKSEGTASDQYSLRIFWKLYHREISEDRDLKEINTLLFQWKREDEEKEFNLLGGLFGLKKSPEGSSFKIFFIPLG